MIVLVHGAGGNGLVFSELLAELGREAHAPSLPGRLDDAAPLTSVEAMAHWVIAHTYPRIVVGHSLGGAIAIEVALHTELEGLVLIATGARLRVHPAILDAMERAVQDGIPAKLSAWHSATPSEIIARFDARATRTPPAAALADWRAANAFDRMQDLSRIECPTLLIGGAEDALTPEKYLRYLETNVPDARLEMIEHAGHMVPYERPADVARLIDAFADDVLRD